MPLHVSAACEEGAGSDEEGEEGGAAAAAAAIAATATAADGGMLNFSGSAGDMLQAMQAAGIEVPDAAAAQDSAC